MTIILIFWCLMLLCCGVAIVLGGSDGRVAAGLILVASIMTAVAQQANMDWRSVNIGVMLVDIALLIALIILMLRSKSFWPIWMAAAQCLAVASHLATLFVPQFDAKTYAATAAGSSLICLICMTLGILLDWRAKSMRSATRRI